jgi:hypothetical protein
MLPGVRDSALNRTAEPPRQRRRLRVGHAALVLGVCLSSQTAAAQVIKLDGEAPAGAPDHFFLPFDVPAGTQEIEVRHVDGSQANILDFGLEDPTGQRGWGGDTAEPTIVNASAASRGYQPGAITPGRWRVIVGKAKVVEAPARYAVEVELRGSTTLAPDPTRATYAPPAPRAAEARWYKGDFHVHSRESTDAKASLADDAALAVRRGLDFIEISDHNTTTQLDFFNDVAAKQPSLLLLPGIEVTTYAGHANAIGATRWVEHKIGQPAVTMAGSVDAVIGQGALFAINHPVLDLGTLCIGCAWKHEVDPTKVSAVEIATGSGASLLADPALAFWDDLLSRGSRAAAIGGSDDHRAGVVDGPLQSPIGSPTTLVYAPELSPAAVVAAVRAGRTVVKLTGPDDPMAEVEVRAALTGPPLGKVGDTTKLRSAYVRATITGASGQRVRLVKNGTRLDEVDVTADPFSFDLRVEAPAQGQDRYRAEVLVDGKLRTVTSHVWVSLDPSGPEAAVPPTDDGGCRAAPRDASRATALVAAIAAAIAYAAARRARSRA